MRRESSWQRTVRARHAGRAWSAAGLNSTRFVVSLSALLMCAALHASETITYQYDALGRLISTSRSGGTQTAYSLDPSGNRTQVQTSGVTTPTTPPWITVPSSSTGSYTISWGASTSGIVTAYELYESTSAGFSPQSLAYSGTNTAHPVSSKPAGTYYYRVRACNAGLCTGYMAGSNPVTVQPPAAPAITLDNVSASGEDSLGSMSFSYNLTSGGGVTISTTGAVSYSGPASNVWITPQTGMNLYQAQATSACPNKTGTFGTWQTLGTGTTRSWGVNLIPNKSAFCTITVSISAIANPSVILDSATIDLELSTLP
jgi:YD repeat-containing protein